MPKTTRPKKRRRPRLITAPPFLADCSFKKDSDRRGEDRSFLLRIANRTADKTEVLWYVRQIQAAWVLASRMEKTQELRRSLLCGILLLDTYLNPQNTDTIPPEALDLLCRSVETARAVWENAEHLERMQAMNAVISGRVTAYMAGGLMPEKKTPH